MHEARCIDRFWSVAETRGLPDWGRSGGHVSRDLP